MAKNPKWHRDEIILALDLYFQSDRGTIDAKNPKVVELSRLLNTLPIFKLKPDLERFRNPNGVCLKLSNFMAIDPSYKGKGMQSHSKLDKEVFDEFNSNKKRLHQLSEQIRKISNNDVLNKSVSSVEDDEEAILDSVKEGQVLYKYHKYRERGNSIVKEKKKAILKGLGKLECEICQFDFAMTYGILGAGFMECHHRVPLFETDIEKITRLEDLALVCSNCHRMLHRSIDTLTVENLKRLIVR
ncbi:MAG TPA: HNH endonuclease [Bacteroidia bacterium]|jgi:5-methylcytosine-specific restriction protein A|nr:HNH endonuclease [Bacteroidia bacterium]